MFRARPENAIDFYKAGHADQRPAGSEYVYSNLTPRSLRHSPCGAGPDRKVVVFGIQGFVREFLVEAWNRDFFGVPEGEVAARHERRMRNALGAGAVSSGHIRALHRLGYLPVRVKALPEGARVGARVPFVTFANTHPGFSWLTGYLEDAISNENWQAITNATIAYQYRANFEEFARVTGAPEALVPFQSHDFSFRGMEGAHAGARSGAAHLTSNVGTDTVLAVDYLEDYYGADSDRELVGCSVPASEHSVSSSNIIVIEAALREAGEWGGRGVLELLGRAPGAAPPLADEDYREAAEAAFLLHFFTVLYPTGVASYVADTYDYWRVLTVILPRFRDEILARGPGASGPARAVFRPDSGDPVKVVCGDPEAPHGSPQRRGSAEVLWDVFGGRVNERGDREIDPRVGLIYGDSITLGVQREILERLAFDQEIASGCIVLGVGSFTYQRNTRDTLGIAIKATSTTVSGRRYDIYKDPRTDDGTKRSARGLLRVDLEGGEYVLRDRQTPEQEAGGELRLVFEDGRTFNETTLAEVRARLWPPRA